MHIYYLYKYIHIYTQIPTSIYANLYIYLFISSIIYYIIQCYIVNSYSCSHVEGTTVYAGYNIGVGYI